MVQWRNLEAHCSGRHRFSTYLLQLEKFAFVLQDMRYTISEPYHIPKCPSRVSSRSLWSTISNAALKSNKTSTHTWFSAQYSSRCYCGWWRPQFQLKGTLCKLIDRQAVNCVLHSVHGNEQRPQVRSPLIWNSETLVRSLAWMTFFYTCLHKSVPERNCAVLPAKLVLDPRSSVSLVTRRWSGQPRRALLVWTHPSLTNVTNRHSISAFGVLSVDCIIFSIFPYFYGFLHKKSEI